MGQGGPWQCKAPLHRTGEGLGWGHLVVSDQTDLDTRLSEVAPSPKLGADGGGSLYLRFDADVDLIADRDTTSF